MRTWTGICSSALVVLRDLQLFAKLVVVWAGASSDTVTLQNTSNSCVVSVYKTSVNSIHTNWRISRQTSKKIQLVHITYLQYQNVPFCRFRGHPIFKTLLWNPDHILSQNLNLSGSQALTDSYRNYCNKAREHNSLGHLDLQYWFLFSFKLFWNEPKNYSCNDVFNLRWKLPWAFWGRIVNNNNNNNTQKQHTQNRMSTLPL